MPAAGTVLDHRLHGGLVGVLAVVVAPLAVMIGRGARSIGTAVVGREYHAAALAIVLGHFEQMRQGLAGHGGNEFHHVDTRCDLSTFPTADGLACDEELSGELLLSKVMGATDGNELFCKGHGGSFLLVDGLSIRGGRCPSKQPLVARRGPRRRIARNAPHLHAVQ